MINSIVKYKKSYWLITDVYKTGSYVSVIKCSKTGKTYKEANGFPKYIIEKLIAGEKDNSFELIRVGGKAQKANIEDGIESGKRKRRIQFLEARIKSDTEELKSLYNNKT